MKDLLSALTNIEHCMDQLKEALDELGEVGVVYISSTTYRFSDVVPSTIFLKSGIIELATAFDKKVESEPTSAFGQVKIGDIVFSQSKLPVEREDRYE